MKIIPEKPIDNVYMEALEQIAEWNEETLDFAIKQCISLHHAQITKKEES